MQFSNSPLLVTAIDKLNMSVTSVHCGGMHAAILTQNGEAYMWGRNQEGQCAQSLEERRILNPSLVHRA